MPYADSETGRLGAKLGGLARTRPADHPDRVATAQQLAEAKIRQAIERAVADAPPLTPEQRDRLVAILRAA